MNEQEQNKIEENFKELLQEVSKIGEVIQEIPVDEEENEEVLQEDTSNNDEQNEKTEETKNITTLQPSPVKQIEKFVPTDENLEEYVYNSATTLINSSLSTLERVKRTVSSVVDHRELTALAELIKATTSSIDVLNKVVMENKKLKHSKEIKEMDIAAKKELGSTRIKNQTNILVTSREEVLKQLVDKTLDSSQIIDVPNEDILIENNK